VKVEKQGNAKTQQRKELEKVASKGKKNSGEKGRGAAQGSNIGQKEIHAWSKKLKRRGVVGGEKICKKK